MLQLTGIFAAEKEPGHEYAVHTLHHEAQMKYGKLHVFQLAVRVFSQSAQDQVHVEIPAQMARCRLYSPDAGHGRAIACFVQMLPDNKDVSPLVSIPRIQQASHF
ncbi:hypothetical protein D3C76_1555110 [compost metagenome]